MLGGAQRTFYTQKYPDTGRPSSSFSFTPGNSPPGTTLGFDDGAAVPGPAPHRSAPIPTGDPTTRPHRSPGASRPCESRSYRRAPRLETTLAFHGERPRWNMTAKADVRDRFLALRIGQSDDFEPLGHSGMDRCISWYGPIHRFSAEPGIASSAVERFTSRTLRPKAEAEVYDDRATNRGHAGGKQATR